MGKKEVYAFPVILLVDHDDNDAVLVSFPDLENCEPNTETLAAMDEGDNAFKSKSTPAYGNCPHASEAPSHKEGCVSNLLFFLFSLHLQD